MNIDVYTSVTRTSNTNVRVTYGIRFTMYGSTWTQNGIAAFCPSGGTRYYAKKSGTQSASGTYYYANSTSDSTTTSETAPFTKDITVTASQTSATFKIGWGWDQYQPNENDSETITVSFDPGWTAAGGSTVNSITDNGNNTFTVVTTMGTDGTNNAVSDVHIYWRWNNSNVTTTTYDSMSSSGSVSGRTVTFSNVSFNRTGTLYVRAYSISAQGDNPGGTVKSANLAVITAVGQPSLNVSISDGDVTVTCTKGSNGTHNAATGVHVELSEDGGTTYSTITLSNNTYSKHYSGYTCIKVRAYTTPTVSGYQSSWNTKGPYDVYPYSVGPQVGVTADPEHSTSPEYMSELDSEFRVHWTNPGEDIRWHRVILRRGTITNGVITWNPTPLDEHLCPGQSASYRICIFQPPTGGWGFDTSVENVVGATVQWLDEDEQPLCPVSNETDNPMSGFTHTYVRVYTGEPSITFYGNGGYVETYRRLEAATTPPQWEPHKYYSYNSVTGEYIETQSKPSNWSTTYTNYFEYIVSEGPVVVLKSAGVPLSMPPAFWSHVRLDTVYTTRPTFPIYVPAEWGDVGNPPWAANTYYRKSGSTYILSTSKPADWASTWSTYYTYVPVYKHVAATASSAATWQEQARTSQPSDWSSNWGSYYIVDNSVPVPYNYIGYNTSPKGTGTEYPSTSKYTGSHDLTLYAKYQINTHTVTFYDGYSGARVGQPITVNHGSSITDSQIPDPPNRGAKYTFNGWSGGGYNWTKGQSPEPQRMIISDVNVYAQWGSAPIWIFNNNGWKPYLPQE